MIENYVDALTSEIELTSKLYSGKTVDTIFLGGGTPSYLPDGSVKRIMKAIRKNYKLSLSPEITIEINPDSATRTKLVEYKHAGINRLSIGFQTANDKVLSVVNRTHTKADFLKVVNLAKKLDFKNISADLMLGLPTQTLCDVKKAIKLLTDLKIQHISAYDLILEEHTPLYRKVKEGKIKLVSENLTLKMQNCVVKTLQKSGFCRYEVSNYAKVGFESKHNLKYWNLEDYLGLGLAAHSKIGNKRFANTENLIRYIDNIKNNELSYATEETLTLEDIKEEFIMLGLRKTEGITLDDYKKLAGENLVEARHKSIEAMLIKGLIAFEDGRLYATKKGFNFLNYIIKELV